ncbi:hypothetical protein MG293_019070 [Ovis ammon polii]|uniref:Triggering receptor expressed on myeloid cells 1 n=1 Tax=Ovis ammon polii TaxID=230172 RepID=A0AAD4TN60_OVIAM|nr:hypothetical protein MG293_019070 [Ovis ammon polii]
MSLAAQRCQGTLGPYLERQLVNLLCGLVVAKGLLPSAVLVFLCSGRWVGSVPQGPTELPTKVQMLSRDCTMGAPGPPALQGRCSPNDVEQRQRRETVTPLSAAKGGPLFTQQSASREDRGLRRLLYNLEIQAAAKLFEEKCTLAEGQTLNVSCPTNTNIYSNSQKAWQRLKDNGEVQTLAITEGSSQVQKGKYFLEDMPSEGMLQVRMTNLQVEDSGLYRCVILGPSDPIILFYPVRLVVTKNSLGTPDSDEYPCQISVQNPTLPPVTTKLHPRPRPRPVTQLVPTSADRLSSPGLTVTPTNVTHVTRIRCFSFSPSFMAFSNTPRRLLKTMEQREDEMSWVSQLQTDNQASSGKMEDTQVRQHPPVNGKDAEVTDAQWIQGAG